MADIEDLKRDLDFVSAAVHRGRRDLGTAPIYFLWAAIILVGFALPDFAPHWAMRFWVVAGIAGSLLSVWLGSRDAKLRGVNDAAKGWREGQHWLAVGVGGAVLMWVLASGRVPSREAAALLLLFIGVGYTLAGVHLHAPLRWPGLMMMAASLGVLLLDLPYLWTTTGVLVSTAMTIGGIAALREARRNG